MDGAKIRALLEGCAAAAEAGAAVLRERWSMPRTVDRKGAIDLVTDADRASEEAVLRVLAERFPGAAVLAEESGTSGIAGAGLRFLVDPLDGTTNYAHGLPHFAVTVAALDARGVAAGATCDPMRRERFLAARGLPATLDGRPIRCARAAEVAAALLVTGFPYDVHATHAEVLRLLGPMLARAQGVRRLGAAALDLAWVACGRMDGYWEAKLKPWDMAAGLLLVEGAGGVTTDLDGGDRALELGSVLAANPVLHPKLLEIVGGAGGGW